MFLLSFSLFSSSVLLFLCVPQGWCVFVGGFFVFPERFGTHPPAYCVFSFWSVIRSTVLGIESAGEQRGWRHITLLQQTDAFLVSALGHELISILQRSPLH